MPGLVLVAPSIAIGTPAVGIRALGLGDGALEFYTRLRGGVATGIDGVTDGLRPRAHRVTRALDAVIEAGARAFDAIGNALTHFVGQILDPFAGAPGFTLQAFAGLAATQHFRLGGTIG